MRQNSIRTTITTSTFTLPSLIGLAVILFALYHLDDMYSWLGLGMACIITFLLTELNNRNALIRVRSRMICSTFLFCFTMCPSLHRWSPNTIPMLCLVLTYYQLFAAYQKVHSENNTFTSFLFLGIASMVYPKLLYCIPIVYLGLLIPLRTLHWKSFWAGIFGILVPYWFLTGWAIWHEKLDSVFLPYIDGLQFAPIDYSAIPTNVLTTVSCITFLSLCAIAHFTYTAYNDKIRTRMNYYIIISIELFLIIFFYLQPQDYPVLSGLLLVNSAPLIAHYFTLGKGRILNYWFIISFIALIIITIFNYLEIWTLLSIS